MLSLLRRNLCCVSLVQIWEKRMAAYIGFPAIMLRELSWSSMYWLICVDATPCLYAQTHLDSYLINQESRCFTVLSGHTWVITWPYIAVWEFPIEVCSAVACGEAIYAIAGWTWRAIWQTQKFFWPFRPLSIIKLTCYRTDVCCSNMFEMSATFRNYSVQSMSVIWFHLESLAA